MKTIAVGDLVHLPARRALARYFDGLNYRVVRRLMLAVTPMALVVGLLHAVKGEIWSALVWTPMLAVALTIFFVRRGRIFERYGRQLSMLLLALLVVAIALSFAEPEASYAFAGYVLPSCLLFFRLTRGEFFSLAGVDLGAMGLALFRDGMPADTAGRVAMASGALIFTAIIVGIALGLTRRAKSEFLEAWRKEVSRERDRSRMRSELEDARDIQLSMLPVGSPKLSWADFSSVSLPASEVGGDYFDYFELDGSRMAIVIGDVAGHGVASGLVLSGVRSSLHLLRDELIHPVTVLEKLDRMLRATVGGRLFVTFQIVLLDPALGQVRVANAGHPPLLLASSRGPISRLGKPSLPLGTRLEGTYEEERATMMPGDTLLLFSDGVPEVRNLHDDGFGEQRLVEELRRASSDASARLIRDSLLNGLSRFKGDAEQEDDLTLVVLKVGELGH